MILTRKRLTTLLSFLVCVLLAAALLKWSSNYRTRVEAEAHQASEGNAETIPVSSFNRLTYYNGSTTLDFILNEDDQWVWTADQDFPLDDSVIQRILTLLENLQPLQTMEAPEELEEYHLGSSPAATLSASGEEHQLSLIFGKETEDGNRYTLQNGDTSTIYVLPSELLEPMAIPIYDMMVLPQIPKMAVTRLNFIRIYGKTLEDGSYEDYTVLTAQRPDIAEGETLTADDITWRSNGANVTDHPMVQELLTQLTTLSIDKCLDYNPSGEAASLCGFDAPSAILEAEFYTEGGAEQSLLLTVGNTLPDGSSRYVRYGETDPTLYRLSNAALDALLRIAAEGLEG